MNIETGDIVSFYLNLKQYTGTKLPSSYIMFNGVNDNMLVALNCVSDIRIVERRLDRITKCVELLSKL